MQPKTVAFFGIIYLLRLSVGVDKYMIFKISILRSSLLCPFFTYSGLSHGILSSL
jgi:hypothetical protein